jgi:hypothetical protein
MGVKFFWWRRKDSLNAELDGLGQGEDWERRTLQKLALDALSEQKRARNWGILFKSLTFIYVAVVLGMTVDWTSYRDATVGARHTALVDLVGVIEARGDANGDKLITASIDQSVIVWHDLANKDKNQQVQCTLS